jgi:ribosomal protein S16
LLHGHRFQSYYHYVVCNSNNLDRGRLLMAVGEGCQ